jgi:transketolase
MRAAFARTLTELADGDPRIVLLTGDLGYMALEVFSERHPDRFFNVGVAEQNMVGIATGLAEGGFIPFVYSIATFASLRPYEFIRNGPIHHQLPVRIIGVGGGFEYGSAGPTHHCLEDVGVMRVQPGIAIVAPADYEQARTALLKTWDMPGPVYYRIGKNDKVVIPGLNGRFDVGDVQVLVEGGDVLILSMGSVSLEAAAAVELLARRGIGCSAAIIASVSPPPVAPLSRLLRTSRAVVVVEAHYASGGIGSLVSEIVAEQGIPVRVKRCAVRGLPDGISGSEMFLHQKHHLAREAIAEATEDFLAELDR